MNCDFMKHTLWYKIKVVSRRQRQQAAKHIEVRRVKQFFSPNMIIINRNFFPKDILWHHLDEKGPLNKKEYFFDKLGP